MVELKNTLCGGKMAHPPNLWLETNRHHHEGFTKTHTLWRRRKNQLRSAMAAELCLAPPLSTCAQHRRPLQSRRNSLFHLPALPLPFSPLLFSSSTTTTRTRGRVVLCQTAQKPLFDAERAAQAGQNRLLKVLSTPPQHSFTISSLFISQLLVFNNSRFPYRTLETSALLRTLIMANQLWRINCSSWPVPFRREKWRISFLITWIWREKEASRLNYRSLYSLALSFITQLLRANG